MSFLLHLRETLMSVIAAISRARRPGTGGGGGGAPVVPYLNSITLGGDTTAVATHQTTVYGILAQTDQQGLPFAGNPGPYTYRSSNTGVGTVDATGKVTAISAGTTNITVETTNSRQTVITSNAVTLTVSAQVATTSTVSPSSATMPNPGTQQFTAVVYDQATVPAPISGATGTWDTSDHSKATISVGGLATAVAGTSGTPINVTFTSGSAVGTATVSVSATSSVQSVSLVYTNPNTGVAQGGQMLLFTGVTYSLSAFDQVNNPLDGTVGTFSSSDPTNCPVGSTTGIIAPNAAMAGATITYTHTASGHTGTIACTVAKTPGAWLKLETVPYTTDAQLRSNILSSVTTVDTNGSATPPPTGGSNSLYQDGKNEGGLTLDSTRPFMGNRTLLMNFPQASAPPQLTSPLPGSYTRIWAIVVKRYDAGFTTAGNGIGGAASYKDGPFFYNSGQQGRAGVLYTNGNQVVGEALLQASGGVVGGADESPSIGAVTTQWSDQQYIVDILLYEIRSNSVMSERVWRATVGANPSSASLVTNTAIEGAMLQPNAPMRMNYIAAMGQNYNRGIPAGGYKKSLALWGAVDGVTYGDPFGVLGTQSTPTLTGITGGTVQPGDTSKTIVLTGTNFNANCYPVFSNPGIVAHYTSTSYTSNITITSTSITMIVDVTSAAALGAGTVAVYNAGSQVTTATQVMTVGALAAPGAPTAANANAVNNLTLTFPVTLNASGTLPDSLAWQYSTDDVSYTAGSDLPLSSPSLGQVVQQQVILNAASTLYYVKFAEKNGGGTSSYATRVTGTTGTAPGLITANLIMDINPDAGLDVSTDGAGVGSLTDQSATAGQFFQGTGSKKPILKLGLYNGHNALRFTSTNATNLTTSAAISAYNSTDCTIYVVCASLTDAPTNNQRIFANFNSNGGSLEEGFHITHTGGGTVAELFAGQGNTAATILNFATNFTVASGLHCLTAVLNHTSGTYTIYYDGVQITTSTANYAKQVTNPSVVSLGSDKGSGNYLDGDIVRIPMFSAAHTSTQVAQEYSALKALYPMLP